MIKNIRDERIIDSYPKVAERKSWKFNLFNYETPDQFIVISYLVDLKDSQTREKYASSNLKFGYHPEYIPDAEERQDEEIKFDLLGEYEQIKDDQDKAGRIDEIFETIQGIEEVRLKEHIEYIKETKIPEIKGEMRMYSENPIEGMREMTKVDDISLRFSVQDLSREVYLLPQIDLTKAVLGIKRLYGIWTKDIEELKWKLEFLEKSELLKMENIGESDDKVCIIYKPVLSSNRKEEFDLPDNVGLNLILA